MSLPRLARFLLAVLPMALAASVTSVVTAPAASAAGFTISPTAVAPGAQVTVQVSSCPTRYAWLGVYGAGATNEQYGSWTYCRASWTFTAPATAGTYQVRGFSDNSDGNWFDDQFGSANFRVTDPRCRAFTSTIRWANVRVGDLIDARIPVPDAARDYANRIIARGGAYAQLKGSWCWDGGRVTSRSIRPLESALAGQGPAGVVFSVRSIATGRIEEERYNGATRYRISQSTARVFLSTPGRVTLTVPGTRIGIEIPAGTSRAIFDMRMDTLLTGSGNAECAPTATCDVEVGPTYRP